MRNRNDANNDFNGRDQQHQGSRHERDDESGSPGFGRQNQGNMGSETSARHDQDSRGQGARGDSWGQNQGRDPQQSRGFDDDQGNRGNQYGNENRGYQARGMGNEGMGHQGRQDRGYQSNQYGSENRGYQGSQHQGGQYGSENRGYQGGQYGNENRGYQGGQYGNESRGYQGGQYGNEGRGYQGGQYGTQGGQLGNQGSNYPGGQPGGHGWGQNIGPMGAGGQMQGGQMTKGRGPKGYKRSDQRIEEDINDRLMHQHEIDASEVEVKVSGGEVTLTGTVEGRHFKHMVENLVDGVGGVQEIHNQIRVKRQGQDDNAARDTQTQSSTSKESNKDTQPSMKNSDDKGATSRGHNGGNEPRTGAARTQGS